MSVTPASVNGSTPADRRPVLIGFAHALAAPETAWSLLEAGIPVVAFAKRGSRPSLRLCRGVRIVEITAPEQDAAAAIADLSAQLARPDAYRAVMPLDDTALWLCDQVWQRGTDVEVIGATGPQAALALDKGRQLEAAAAAGFAVPPTIRIETVSELLALSDLPVVLKPSEPVSVHAGRLHRGANYICGDRDELQRVADTWAGSEPLLAQPVLSGVGEGLFGLAGPERLVALSAHRRVRMANPQGSGSSACVSTAVQPALAASAQAMLSAAQWRGMFMLEFLRGHDGTAWFMELNGRTWGSMALARRLGLEYPAWAVRQAAEPGFDPGVTPREGLVCRHLGRELVHVLMVVRGPKSMAVTGWPSRGRAVRDVFTVRRSDRWYNWRRGEAGLFVDDAVRTVLVHLPGRRG